MSKAVRALHRFWFGELTDAGLPTESASARWFRGGAAFDRECAAGFGALIDQALAGGLEEWRQEPRGALALILLLDQLPRNVHRGTALAFAGDERALGIAEILVDAGDEAGLLPVERYFVSMPFEHAEDLAAQSRAVSLFEALAAEVPAGSRKLFTGGVTWARRHHAVMERFGRFPSRNAVLGRETTPEEAEFLTQHPAGF